jgi:hypothetical protein
VDKNLVSSLFFYIITIIVMLFTTLSQILCAPEYAAHCFLRVKKSFKNCANLLHIIIPVYMVGCFTASQMRGKLLWITEIISSVYINIKSTHISTCHIHVAGHATQKQEKTRNINDIITLKYEDNMYCVH